jgi:hypothetical protein
MSVRAIIGNGRRLVATTFLDRCYIRDRTLVRDTTGGTNETWIERPSSTKCRFVRLTDDDPEIRLASVYGSASAILLLPIDTLTKEGDRVRAVKDNSIWVVTKTLTPPSETKTVDRVGIREL